MQIASTALFAPSRQFVHTYHPAGSDLYYWRPTEVWPNNNYYHPNPNLYHNGSSAQGIISKFYPKINVKNNNKKIRKIYIRKYTKPQQMSNNYNNNNNDNKQEEECNGYENFLGHLNLWNLSLGYILSFIGLGSLILSILSQLYAYFSAYKISIPSLILTIWGYVNNNVPQSLQTFFDIVGAICTLINIFIILPLGDFLNYIGALAQVLCIVTVAVDTFNAFPKLGNTLFKILFGIDLEIYFKGYGCEKKKRLNSLVHKYVMKMKMKKNTKMKQ